MARRPNDPQRRERILQATLDTIAAHGIHAVTHRKIATCANVPLGSLTYYFSGIEALIEEAFSLFTAEMSAQYQQGFVGVTNREQACDAIADLIFSAQVTTARNVEGGNPHDGRAAGGGEGAGRGALKRRFTRNG